MTLTVEKMRRAIAAMDSAQRAYMRIIRWPRLKVRHDAKELRAFRSQHARRRMWGRIRSELLP
jgi:hypothetical protein